MAKRLLDSSRGVVKQQEEVPSAQVVTSQSLGHGLHVDALHHLREI